MHVFERDCLTAIRVKALTAACLRCRLIVCSLPMGQITKSIFMKNFIFKKKLKRTQHNYSILSLLATFLLQLGLMGIARADFINGGFESPYTPSGSVTTDPITGWTLTGYTFNGSAATTPVTSISGINLGPASIPGGITDIYDASNPSQPDDYFLFGTTPAPTLLLPGTGLQSASVNLRSGHAPLTVSGITAKPPTWTHNSKQATSISQRITVQASDIDPVDGKVHVRFIASPVLENPAHSINQQPFFAIQLNNVTTGRTGADPLFFQWKFAAQPGTPWKNITSAGSNPGSNTSYQYMDWQSFDMSPGNAYIHVGDTIEVVVIASGCSLGGHDGHVYLDDVHTAIPANLWVSATGPASTTPGANVTYTYTYTNNGSLPVNNVTVVANLPQGTPPLNGGGGLTPVTPAQNTTYVSNTNPTTGSCSGAGPVTCSIGTLQPGQSGTFTVTVAIPNTWVTTPDTTHTSGPVNNGNYPISGTGVPALLGPLVQTTLSAPTALSNLTANTGGMPATAIVGTPYTGSFTCANISNANATGDAPNASCDIANLPAGLAVSQCTITPSNAVWVQPAAIPANQTVTCDVSGTPTATGRFVATVTTNAPNNSNSTGASARAPIAVSGAGVADMVAASSLPTTGSVSSPYTGSFTCTNNSGVTATSVHCAISGLPTGVAVSSCSSPTLNPWVDGSPLPAHQAVTCTVSGTPQNAGTVTATVATSATNEANTSNDTSQTTISISAPTGPSISNSPISLSTISTPTGIPVPATLNGASVLNSAIVCCGRPVILHNLPGPGKTIYKVTARTGNLRCIIGHTKSQTYLKINGSRGSCTVVGFKNGITTLPLTLSAPTPLRVGKPSGHKKR
jgi:uncharacterized repeat protein (TIGR01451 family)